MLADYSLIDSEAREIGGLIDRYEQTPASDETSGKWAQEAWATLIRTHGSADAASAALADAQKLIKRDPRVAAILNATRLGNHPRIVLKAVALAKSEKGK